MPGRTSSPICHERGCEAVIPPYQRAKVKREYDTWLYRERHLVECCFNKLKHFRRIISRFDKLHRSFLGFVQLACALGWLRRTVLIECQQNPGTAFDHAMLIRMAISLMVPRTLRSNLRVAPASMLSASVRPSRRTS